MTVAVIGGSGFIGSRLVATLLEAGRDVRIIDKIKSLRYPELTIVADVRNEAALLEALRGCDVIWNLAAEHLDNVSPTSLYYEVNVDGARNVCEAATKLCIQKIIFTSSVAVYGFTNQDTDENGEKNPFNDYGKSKLQAEQVYEDWLLADKTRNLVIIRPSVVFGESNRGNVYNLLNQIATGRFIMIGNGQNKKSMAYVGNVAAFLGFCESLSGHQIFNYADKPDLNMNELTNLVSLSMNRRNKIRFRLPYSVGIILATLIDIIAKIINRKFTVSAIRVKKFCESTQFSSCHITDTGFNAPFSLNEGMSRTLTSDFGVKLASDN
ncbi:NAD-dependent epimerase/dehydratase family protein [Geothrix oryzisoli]|uniref:NAD-dependent epimerase/dehydratase family protein n=1 Tax=Geothrix oryzisoli TaxID=2922721 RepID=UPI001FAC81F6|nr:NAD-dependent epimerase/dehydratase family protein [Geothrix oryzisoli]